ncbi:MAG: Gfo/Idh/MocA family oxidoreductase [Planctomycetaceae bacterium]|jgi:predicted dehydrogenase|nr:Gfo/Idh/MocA family oxidoreductase [Planctomycetaceae bacterium]
MLQNNYFSRRHFLQTSGVFVAGTTLAGNLSQASSVESKQWKVAIVQDSSKPTLGFHGLHAAFRGLPNVEIVAHVDSNTKNIEQKMLLTQAKRHYTTCEKMLEHESPDIVVLTSRLPNDHLEQIRLIAQKGCHLYCEKPLSAFLHEADEIVTISEKNRIKIGMAHHCRYGLGFLTMKRLIESGKIGTPLTVQGWGKSDHRGGGEDLMVLGTHILDLMTFIFGSPECVMSDIRNQGRPATVSELTKTVEPIGPAIGDEIYAVFRFSGGVRGIFESRRHLYKGNYRMGICATGSKGMLSLRFLDGSREVQQLRFSNIPCAPPNDSITENIPLKEDRIIPNAEPLDSLYEQLNGKAGVVPSFIETNRFAVWDLMQAIQENRQPVSNVYNARQTLEMIYGVYAAHITKTTVNFPLTNRTHPLEQTDSQ